MYDFTAQAPGSAKLVALNCVNVDASAGVHVVASACVDVDVDVDVVASACGDVVASVDVVVNAGSTK